MIEVVDGDGGVIQDGQQIRPNVKNLRRRTPQAFDDIFQMVVPQLPESLLHLLGGQQLTADAERGILIPLLLNNEGKFGQIVFI